MPVVVVTVTQPAAVTVAPTNSTNTSSLSPGATAGIAIGALLGGVIFVALVLYLLNHYRGHRFTRVLNPPDADAAGADFPRLTSRKSHVFSRHSQKPSISSEPLITSTSLPPLRPHSCFDLDGIIASGTISSLTELAPQPLSLSRPSNSNAPPRTFVDDAPSTPPKLPQPLFLHRIVKSRSQGSEAVSLAPSPSLDLSLHSTTPNTSNVRVDEVQLLPEAERATLRDETMTRAGGEVVDEGEVGWEEVESAGSVYSQVSAPIDHSAFFSNPMTLTRKKSSRRHRALAPTVELSPVAEMSDTQSQTISSAAELVASSSLDAQLSHGTTSPPGTTLPLLTSVNFGKSSGTSHTPTLSLSTMGLKSNSSGSASRYPSFGASSMLSSRSGPSSDGETDWHNLPSGLAGLTSLQIGSLQSPYSPVEERPPLPQHPEVLFPAKRAHLRTGTTSSVPEVEKRDVMQGGIASIDVAL